jgi:hypothetical protein
VAAAAAATPGGAAAELAPQPISPRSPAVTVCLRNVAVIGDRFCDLDHDAKVISWCHFHSDTKGDYSRSRWVLRACYCTSCDQMARRIVPCGGQPPRFIGGIIYRYTNS